MKSREEIEQEIERLKPFADEYNADMEDNDCTWAAAATDTLRWVLGYGEPISSSFTKG